MQIRKKNVARLASLSALGAGALAVGTGTAEAAIVYQPLDTVIGLDGVAAWQGNLPGSQFIRIYRYTSTIGKVPYTWKVRAKGYGVEFNQVSSGILRIAGAGQRYQTATLGYTARAFLVAARNKQGSTWGHASFSHEYALFRVLTGGTPLYGWVELSNVVSAGHGPDVTLEGWAYDDQGIKIAAGDGIPVDGVPEPSTMASTGLAALALGAAGLRRWRAARERAA
jgi:hypothetical protein